MDDSVGSMIQIDGWMDDLMDEWRISTDDFDFRYKSNQLSGIIQIWT